MTQLYTQPCKIKSAKIGIHCSISEAEDPFSLLMEFIYVDFLLRGAVFTKNDTIAPVRKIVKHSLMQA